MAVSHIKNDDSTIGDFTESTTMTIVAATDLVCPVDLNSAHNQFYSLTGNTTGNSTASGTNVLFAEAGSTKIVDNNIPRTPQGPFNVSSNGCYTTSMILKY